MDERKSCYVYLADDVDKKELLTVYCKVAGYSKDEAKDKVAEDLKMHRSAHTYKLIYMGIIHFEDVDQEIIERQDEFFEKHTPIWISSCSYR